MRQELGRKVNSEVIAFAQERGARAARLGLPREATATMTTIGGADAFLAAYDAKKLQLDKAAGKRRFVVKVRRVQRGE